MNPKLAMLLLAVGMFALAVGYYYKIIVVGMNFRRQQQAERSRKGEGAPAIPDSSFTFDYLFVVLATFAGFFFLAMIFYV